MKRIFSILGIAAIVGMLAVGQSSAGDKCCSATKQTQSCCATTKEAKSCCGTLKGAKGALWTGVVQQVDSSGKSVTLTCQTAGDKCKPVKFDTSSTKLTGVSKVTDLKKGQTVKVQATDKNGVMLASSLSVVKTK